MEVFKKIWGYLTFKKQESDENSNLNLRMMHGINRISLIMFVIAIVLIILKWTK